MTVSEEEIEAGARALRDRQMVGRITRSWQSLPRSDKRKWRDHAACVLTAAYTAKQIMEAAERKI